MPVHFKFDLLAVAASVLVTFALYHWRLKSEARIIERAGSGYVAALVIGAAIGGIGFGSLNLWISGTPGFARSIVGALAGAIAAIEIFKFRRGIKGSTGLIFVPAFATTVTVGRWGCFFAGRDDETYGTATTLPWGHDFGDGIMRHPVQLYESSALAVFLVFAIARIGTRDPWFARNGFYALVLYYAAQRFIWEFLKPYGTVWGPLNLFHLVCMGLACYALWMMGRRDERTGP